MANERKFAVRNGHALRWWSSNELGGKLAPGGLELLTVRGWTPLGRLSSWLLWRKARAASQTEVDRRRKRAYCVIKPTDDPIVDRRCRFRTWSLVWLLSPPMTWGAPRFLPRGGDTDDNAAADSFRRSLAPPHLIDDGFADQARSGYERARDRRTGIESRAGTFVQVAGLTTTVVLVNSTLLSGRTLDGAWRTVFVCAIVAASACLLAAGAYGLFATMRTFDSVAPDVVPRLITRARIADQSKRRRELVVALLLAHRRTSIVSDWKLARLKRASLWFGAAVVAIAVASASFVIEVEHKPPSRPAAR